MPMTQHATERDPLLTVYDIAERLHVSHESVRRWLRGGSLRGVRLSKKAGWRVRESDLVRFLEAHAPALPDL